MANESRVTFEGDHVKVISNGEKNIEVATRIWTEVVKVCEKHDCYRVLGIADTTVPMDIMDAYDHGKLLDELGLKKKYRIAWVEKNPVAFNSVYFIETVLINRSFTVRLFDDPADAKSWLVHGDGTD